MRGRVYLLRATIHTPVDVAAMTQVLLAAGATEVVDPLKDGYHAMQQNKPWEGHFDGAVLAPRAGLIVGSGAFKGVAEMAERGIDVYCLVRANAPDTGLPGPWVQAQVREVADLLPLPGGSSGAYATVVLAP